MIFILHYILFDAGMPSPCSLLTIFLQTHSTASLTQIGTLLMALPFVSILVKPLFCALADRQQAHKHYLVGSLVLEALGYGSLVVAPTFFPRLVEQSGGRLVWYMDVVGVVVGFSAFGVAWSLGDSLALNAAQKRGVPWGFYRAWATLSWGVFGWLAGQINEVSFLPKYVPGFLILVVALSIEVVLLCFWPSKDFDMSAGITEAAAKRQAAELAINEGPLAAGKRDAQIDTNYKDANQPATADKDDLLGTARLNPRLVAAVAKMAVEDLGSSIRSSLRSPQGTLVGSPASRTTRRRKLADLVGEEALKSVARQSVDMGSPQLDQAAPEEPPKTPKLQHQASVGPGGSTRGRSAWRRTQLSLARMNSLSSASGLAIAQQVDADQSQLLGAGELSGVMVSPQSPRLAAGRLTSVAEVAQPARPADASKAEASGPAEDLQLVLLKIIVRRDKSILKYLVVFTIFGLLLFVHIIYFFMHLEQVARAHGYQFSQIAGYVFIAHSASEIFSFVVIGQHYVPRVGPLVSLLTVAALYALRYGYYATYFAQFSPVYAIITETCHGFAYGIVYTLITDIATDCVDKLDQYLPELIERQIVSPSVDPNSLKLPLRATMQGVFSGAFDGLGQGIGALMAGIYLDYNPYESLWMLCTCISLLFLVVYPLTEWRTICGKQRT